jgi:hypothetical protein
MSFIKASAYWLFVCQRFFALFNSQKNLLFVIKINQAAISSKVFYPK